MKIKAFPFEEFENLNCFYPVIVIVLNVIVLNDTVNCNLTEFDCFDPVNLTDFNCFDPVSLTDFNCFDPVNLTDNNITII